MEKTVEAMLPGRFSKSLNWEEMSTGLIPQRLMLLMAPGRVWIKLVVCSTRAGIMPAAAKENASQNEKIEKKNADKTGNFELFQPGDGGI